MTSYVASESSPEKKLAILASMEMRLLHALKNDLSPAKIATAIEKVRAAMINVCKGRLHLLRRYRAEETAERDERERSNIEAEMQKWEQMAAQEIADIYRKRI